MTNRQESVVRDPRKLLGVAIATVFFAWITLSRGSWPELYTFWLSIGDTASKQPLDIPVQLDDDVMIIMRAGQILLERGIPALNEADIAQPSTSYIAPYLAALLLLFLPSNVAVFGFGLLGFIAAILTMVVLVIVARSTTAGVVIVILLTLTSTNLAFALNGWDHLFQGFIFACATALVMTASGRLSSVRLLSISILLGIGSVTRLDAVLIAFALMGTVVLLDRRVKYLVTRLALPYILIVGVTLAVNLAQFGHLTPTTHRLKVGASPSLGYSLGYFYENTVASYSAATLLIFLILMAVFSARVLGLTYVVPVTAASIATALVAFLNSDAFAAGRMYWVPTVVMACTLLARMPGDSQRTPHNSGTTQLGEVTQQQVTHAPTRALWAIAALFVVALLGSASLSGLERATLGNEGLATREAENFVLAEWINQNLEPSDGAIGVFWAGTSFYMPRFAVADFLGKGDETIATLPRKSGPPGHNKWDFTATLEKWRPQAIITLGNQDLADGTIYQEAKSTMASNPEASRFLFGDAFIVDPEVRQNYQWCKAVDLPDIGRGANLGLLLRNDVVASNSLQEQCAVLWPPPY